MKIKINPAYKNNRAVCEFIQHLPETFEREGVFLYAGRNVIKSFILNDPDPVLQQLVVKRYKHPNPVQRIVYSFFRDTKAARAFRNATELYRRGIATPLEIAYVEQQKGGLFEYGYYISSYDGAPPISVRLTETAEFDRIMAANFAAFAAELHEKGILHHDLNSTNVLYHPENGHYRFSVIDINRMNFKAEGSCPSPAECLENLTRFTGKMDLFEYVARCYAESRKWPVETTVKKALAVKIRHDRKWGRRKAFLRKFSGKRK